MKSGQESYRASPMSPHRVPFRSACPSAKFPFRLMIAFPSTLTRTHPRALEHVQCHLTVGMGERARRVERGRRGEEPDNGFHEISRTSASRLHRVLSWYFSLEPTSLLAGREFTPSTQCLLVHTNSWSVIALGYVFFLIRFRPVARSGV